MERVFRFGDGPELPKKSLRKSTKVVESTLIPNAWRPQVQYYKGDVVLPTTPAPIFYVTEGVQFRCQISGVTSTAEPFWPTIFGPSDSIQDGSVMWVSEPRFYFVPKKLPEINFPYDRVGSYRNGNPFVIAFCYCKNGEKFVVKGGHSVVDPYLQNYPVPMIVHRTIWNNKHSRFTAGVSGRGWPSGSVFIIRNFKRADKRGWTFKFFIHPSASFRAEFSRRRLPRRWMREFNEITAGPTGPTGNIGGIGFSGATGPVLG